MYRNNDFIYDAVGRFEELTNIPVEILSNRDDYDALIIINDIQFAVFEKSEVRMTNIGVVLSQIEDARNDFSKPIILISKYIASEVALIFKNKGINYIDSAGNTSIHASKLVVYIAGQKNSKASKTSQNRAFQEVGIKLLYNILTKPQNLNLSYRRLSEQVGISIGSVSNVINELEELNFILRTDNERILKNKEELLQRWIVAYNEVLRPRLLKKRMRFANNSIKETWKTMFNTEESQESYFWGGEPAAALKTNYLRPYNFTIYTDTNWKSFIKNYGLIPDDSGEIEILQLFWKPDAISGITVSSLLIYTDLINSGDERNIETAKMIFNNDLQYIK